jgi:hypothetical protein
MTMGYAGCGVGKIEGDILGISASGGSPRGFYGGGRGALGLLMALSVHVRIKRAHRRHGSGRHAPDPPLKVSVPEPEAFR